MIPVYQGEAAQRAVVDITAPRPDAERSVAGPVAEIIARVKTGGDAVLLELARRFGDPAPERFQLPASEIEAAIGRVPEDTRALLQQAADNIRAFAQAVMQSIQPVSLDRDGFQAGLDWRAVERVACYVPGGRYPLPSTALMTAITAQVAGVPQICIVSPRFQDEILYAGTLAGVSTFYQLGGAQAVAALAWGTQSIPAADMVVGPGNAYVTEAKRQLQGVIGIDMLAGPSEVLIIADSGAQADWLAWDLLAQAEHDPQARAYLLTESPTLARQVQHRLSELIQTESALPEYLTQSSGWGAILVLPDLAACVDVANRLAPEHLELQVQSPEALKPGLHHYGALFMGYHTPVPLGDYLAGPNHTLPTARTARFSGGLTPLTFLRPQSWIQAAPQTLAREATRFASLEGLTAHQRSAAARLDADSSSRS